jgi:hypothetical protein
VEIETYYLLNVVSHEMDPRIWGDSAALEAQAITSRSYIGWHINNDAELINNSSGFQVFVPYKFDSLNPGHSVFEPNSIYPCFDITINEAQSKSCDAIYHKYYIARSDVDLPAFAEFSGDTIEQTLTHPTPSAFPYIKGVPDPISNATYGALNLGNRRGLSSRGANRWSLGNQYSYPGQENYPWSIKWQNSQQILFHYFTNVHLRDNGGNRISAYNRWNPLSVQWSGPCLPVMIPGYICTATFYIQNTGTSIWSPGTFGMLYHDGDSLNPDYYSTSYPVVISQSVNPGDTISISVPFTLPNSANRGSPHYYRFEMAYWDYNFDGWIGFANSDPVFYWPTYNITVCVENCKNLAPIIRY